MRYLTAFLLVAASAIASAQPSAPGGIAPAAAGASSPSSPASTPPQPPATRPERPGSIVVKPLPPAAPAPLQTALTGQLLYQILLAELTYSKDGLPQSKQQGIQMMIDAARRIKDPALYKRALELALLARSGPDALDAARAWRSAFPQSPAANRSMLQVLLAMGKMGETGEALKSTISSLPPDDRQGFIASLPTMYRQGPDPKVAQQTVEQALADYLKDPVLAPVCWYSMGRLRLLAGDQDGALSAAALGATAAEQAHAPSPWPATLSLEVMGLSTATSENRKAGEAIVKNYMAIERPQPRVETAYAQWLQEQGRTEESAALLTRLIKAEPDYADAWLTLGNLLFTHGQPNQAQSALIRYLDLATRQIAKQGGKTSPDQAFLVEPISQRQQRANMDSARMMLSRLAHTRGDEKSAKEWLSSIKTPEQALTVAIERANIAADGGNVNEGIALIKAVPDSSPEDAVIKIRAQARLLRDHQRAEESYAMLAAAMKTYPEDHDLLYDAALAAGKTNRFDEEERLLRKLMVMDPKSPFAFNALGYDFADRGVRLQEAKELIEKALTLSPADPFINDSLGWVHFRMGMLQDARRILTNAFKMQPDPEIAAHLGEVLHAMGQHRAALNIWRQGLSIDPKNATLLNTLKRLKVHVQ